jgi:hypothetical protein
MTDEIEAGNYHAFPEDEPALVPADCPSIGQVALRDAASASVAGEWIASAGRVDWYYQKGSRRKRCPSIVWSRRLPQPRVSQGTF